jgi:hypothetical protein
MEAERDLLGENKVIKILLAHSASVHVGRQIIET